MNNGSVFCKRHNGRVLCTDLTSTRTPFVVIYLQAEAGALGSNKLELQESLHFVPDASLCNLCSTSRGVTGVTTATAGFMAIQTKRTYPTCDNRGSLVYC